MNQEKSYGCINSCHGKGEKLKKLVDKYDNKHIVDVVALPKLVRFAQDDDLTLQMLLII